MALPSSRGIAGQAGHAVEVRVPAGEVREAVGPHDGDNQGIATEQPGLAAHVRGQRYLAFGDRQDIKTEQGNLVHGLAGTRELLHLRRVPP